MGGWSPASAADASLLSRVCVLFCDGATRSMLGEAVSESVYLNRSRRVRWVPSLCVLCRGCPHMFVLLSRPWVREGDGECVGDDVP